MYLVRIAIGNDNLDLRETYCKKNRTDFTIMHCCFAVRQTLMRKAAKKLN